MIRAFIGLFFIVMAAVVLAATRPVKEAPIKCSTVGFLVVEDGQARSLDSKDKGERQAFASLVQGCKRRYGPDYCPTRVFFNSRTNNVDVTCDRIRGA